MCLTQTDYLMKWDINMPLTDQQNRKLLEAAKARGLNRDQAREVLMRANQENYSQNSAKPLINPNIAGNIGAAGGDILGTSLGGSLAGAAGASAGYALGRGTANTVNRIADPNVSMMDKLKTGANMVSSVTMGLPGMLGNVAGQGMQIEENKGDMLSKAGIAGGLSLASSGVMNIMGKAAKGIPRLLSRNFEKFDKKFAGEAFDRGFDLYEETTKRGLLGDPDKAIKQIAKSIPKQEALIKESIKNAPDTAVITKSQLKKVVDDLAESATPGQEKAMRAMYKKFVSKYDDFSPAGTRELMRKFGKVTSNGIDESSTGGMQALKAMDRALRAALKKQVPGVKAALREEEILYTAREAIKSFRAADAVNGVNLFAPVQGATRVADSILPVRMAAISGAMEKYLGSPINKVINNPLTRALQKTGTQQLNQ